ncbi:MAG: BON domain-containing protein [Candidatus Dormibacteraeota bacterium]|nr:BON domain-containing protein [Candidatus Dormibacteraeota bacterium]
MKALGRISAAVGAGLAGMGAAVFLHPRSGARNRQAAAGVARRQSANVATMVGASVANAPGRGGRKQEQLAEKVRAQLGADHAGAADALHVSAHKSTVTLRGEVSHLDDIDAFEASARSVAGVGDVNNLLRLATPASAGR